WLAADSPLDFLPPADFPSQRGSGSGPAWPGGNRMDRWRRDGGRLVRRFQNRSGVREFRRCRNSPLPECFLAQRLRQFLCRAAEQQQILFVLDLYLLLYVVWGKNSPTGLGEFLHHPVVYFLPHGVVELLPLPRGVLSPPRGGEFFHQGGGV